MPTPTGLPKPGERWRYTQKLPPDWKEESVEVTVIERGRGDYWSLRVRFDDGTVKLWVDPAYWLSQGMLTYVGEERKLENAVCHEMTHTSGLSHGEETEVTTLHEIRDALQLIAFELGEIRTLLINGMGSINVDARVRDDRSRPFG